MILICEFVYSDRACTESNYHSIRDKPDFATEITSPTYRMISIWFFILFLALLATGFVFLYLIHRDHHNFYKEY